MGADEDESLLLAFRIADGASHTQTARPPLRRINNLNLHITGPNLLSLHIDSPVLLLEHSSEQHHEFCLRRDMALSDDTLCRFPVNDSEMVWQLFAQAQRPTLIGFQVGGRTDSELALVRWNPAVNPWPPAIDSQLLVAAMVQYGAESGPCRLLDVGSGTGYLAIAAAHRWPTLEEVHLVDIDPLAMAAAKKNLKADPISRTLIQSLHLRGFAGFDEGVYDTLLCTPPYLPYRSLKATGIEMATNGTRLLEEVVMHGGQISRELWLAFSGLAWPEFLRALSQVSDDYRLIEILRRDFVPFRIPWLEPIPAQDGHNEDEFQKRCRYYSHTLIPRGLIDMDNHEIWPQYLRNFAPNLPANITAEFSCRRSAETLEQVLDEIEADARGYRFWHEVRVVRLVSQHRS